MDNSKEFQAMFDRARESEPCAFANFDVTKNVQDQLQEMVLPSNCFAPEAFIGIIWKWRLNNFEYQLTFFKTMEQFLLGYIMKEKYNKTWNNSDWVTQASL